MSGSLSPASRSLLSAARAGRDATPADRARVRGRILSKIGAGAAVTGVAAAKAVAPKAGVLIPASGSVLGTKVIAAALALAVGAGVGGVAHFRSAPPRAAPQALAPIQVHTLAVPAERESDPEVSATANSPTVIELPASPRQVSEQVPARSVARTSPLDAPSVSTLEDETRLLRSADSALRDNHGAVALALLDQHAARFPSGVLAEERAAERIFVLCALHQQSEAERDAAAFLRDRPRSPLSGRVRSSCGAL